VFYSMIEQLYNEMTINNDVTISNRDFNLLNGKLSNSKYFL